MTKKVPPSQSPLSAPSLAPRADKSLRRQIESIKRQKIVNKKVVSLADFRELRQKIDTRSILVVDDDEIMRSALKRILENEGYKVVLAVDGLELSKVLESTRLDMILLDVNLPWVDGYELCRLIKDHHALRDVPLVLVSARKSKEDIQLGFDAGCNDYVTKPFDIDYMTGVINKMLLKTS
jgi:two-component system aerobic respiration control protein ArcA